MKTKLGSSLLEHLSQFQNSTRDLGWDNKKTTSREVANIFKNCHKYQGVNYRKITPDKHGRTFENEVKNGSVYFGKIGMVGSRMFQCCNFLDFGQTVQDEKTGKRKSKLVKTLFCKNRFCAICSTRISVLRGIHLSKNIDVRQKRYEKEFGYPFELVFCTLTWKNCETSELRQNLERANKAFNNLMRRKTMTKRGVLGYVCNREMTTNKNNPKHYTQHPHLHFLLAVDPKIYFLKNPVTGECENMITHSELKLSWQELLKLDYEPYVHIQKVKNSDKMKSCLETAKYMVKEAFELDFKNESRSDIYYDLNRINLIEIFQQIYNIRSVSTGGILKGSINEEVEDEELLKLDEEFEELPLDEKAEIIRFTYSGFKNFNGYLATKIFENQEHYFDETENESNFVKVAKSMKF